MAYIKNSATDSHNLQRFYMKQRGIFFTLLTILLLGCGNKNDNEPEFPSASNQLGKDSATLDKIAQADSVYAMQQQFNTLHAHGKNLAVHAHQDIPKKRRMLKRAAALRPQRIAAQKRAKERRQQRIKEQQKKQLENQ